MPTNLSRPNTQGRVFIRSVQSYLDLTRYLDSLNDDGISSTAIVVDCNQIAWLAYCTDPDAEWFVECDSPRERMTYTSGEVWYEPVPLHEIKSCGPYQVLEIVG